ncbi:MAG: conjugal transfer protein TraH [Alphaproteobacteria bacterium]|jgi:conjugative transfer pilus assembly protein TraH|nr:conjugal transfer protein TraH [Alphaproteobacteria bacterium]
MARKIVSVLVILTLSCLPSPTEASALDKFFKSLGGQVNKTTPGAFQDQAAGYYTGGGYVLRQNNSVVQPINISLPQLGTGCNNLDLYFGSFSFLQGEQLSQLLRQIGTGVPTYGLQLAMKTMAPQVENLLSQLRKSVQDMNNMMLNSCQASQKIVGGLWPRGTAASEQICMNEKRSGGEDWFGARQHCEKPNSVQSNVKHAQGKYKDLMMGEYNLVWHVLNKMPEYEKNKELASFIMSVTGTLISKRLGDTIRLKVIEPKADQKDFIAAYLKGGTTSQLTCDEDQKCLAPRLTQVTIQDSSAQPRTTMKAKVIYKISELRVKYISKESITVEDIAFLNDAVNVPVYRYIQVSVAAGTPFLMQDAAEYIAANIILTQFDRVMSEVLEAVDALQKIQLEDTAIESFKKNLQSSRSRVQSLLIGANSGSINTLNQTIQAIEQAIVAKNS